MTGAVISILIHKLTDDFSGKQLVETIINAIFIKGGVDYQISSCFCKELYIHKTLKKQKL